MIASYKHNFIYFKTRKTGSTSLEMSLSTYAGPDDIVTPLAFPDEYVRAEKNPEAMARNFSDDRPAEAVYNEAVRKHLRGPAMRAARVPLERVRFYNHINAVKARRNLDEAFWKRAFKFTVERHPYEKAVSRAWMGTRPGEAFEPVLERIVRTGGYANFPLYTDGGNLLVDYIVRYEDLEGGLAHVESVVGISGIRERMPQSKTKYRRDRRPAIELLTRKQKRIIRRKCREEFELLGYET